MTELERKALMGDEQAQEECTRQEIVLPCPFCGNMNIRTSNWGMWRCWCPECRSKSDDCLRERDAIKQWNTRPAPPIGRCGECSHFHYNLENETYCSTRGGLEDPEEYDYCSYFDRGGNENNERD